MQAVALMKTLGSARFMRRMHAGSQISSVGHVDKRLACTEAAALPLRWSSYLREDGGCAKAGYSELNFVPARHRLSAPHWWQDNKGFSEKIYTSVPIMFC